MKIISSAALAALLWLSVVGKVSSEAMMDDFEDRQVAKSISFAVDLAWLPDNRMIVAQKIGKVLMFDTEDDGLKNRRVSLDITDIVCENGERGLGAVQVHPEFDQGKRYIYVYYTYKKFGNCREDINEGPVNRLSRFWLPEGSDKIGRNSERVLFDTPPLEHRYHNAGKIEFGKDGYIYTTVGEGGMKWESQNPGSLLGVVVRLTDNGGIPRSNPYYNDGVRCNDEGVPPQGTPEGTPCQEVHSYGLRNPFRMAMDPNTNNNKVRYFINDVGASFWEEINEGGDDFVNVNYGYPRREGPCRHSRTENCFPEEPYEDPIHYYQHENGGAATASSFIPNNLWPSKFDDGYLYADYVFGKIYLMKDEGRSDCRFECSPPVSNKQITEFASYPNIATMRFGPYKDTQALYYTSIDHGGVIRRISYVGQTNRAPEARIDASAYMGQPGVVIQFSAQPSFDRDGDALMYFWDLDGDGATDSREKDETFQFWNEGVNRVTLFVEDGKGGRDSTTVEIMIGTPPVPKMISPAADDTFSVGQVFLMYGESDNAGDMIEWEVRQHHDTHYHPYLEKTDMVNGQNLQPAPAPEDYYAATNSHLEFIMTVTNNIGLSTTISRMIYPRKVLIEFETDPPGLLVDLDDTVIDTPGTATTWEGQNLKVEAKDQMHDGKGYVFMSWSNGEDRQHYLQIPTAEQGVPKMTAYFEETTEAIIADPPVDGGKCPQVLLYENEAVQSDTWSMKPGTDVFMYQETNGNLVVRKGSKQWPKALVFQSDINLPQGEYFTKLQGDGNLVTRPGSMLRRSSTDVWESGPNGQDGKHFLALDCGGETISVYKGTPDAPQGTMWTSPVGFMVPFEAPATNFHDFVEMRIDKHNGDCLGGPVDARYVDDDMCNQRGSECTIGWTEPNEVLSYSFRAGFDQKVKIRLRAAGPKQGKEFTAWIDGVDASDAKFVLPANGSWMSFDDYVWDVENVPAGQHTLKVHFNDGGVNLCSVGVMTK